MNFSRLARASRLIAAIGLALGSLTALIPSVRADENRWGFGSGIGFTSGTVNGTVFTLGLNVDYYIDRNFSIGPMMLISPTGDLFQISWAGVGRYHFRFNNGVNLIPFIGFGLTHADLDRGTGPGRIDRNDTSWYVPLGFSLEYQVIRNVAISSSLIVNLHDINLAPSLPEKDTTSVALLFGFNFSP